MDLLFLDDKRIRRILNRDERSLSYHARKMGISSSNLNSKLNSSSIFSACFFGKYLKIDPKDLLIYKEKSTLKP